MNEFNIFCTCYEKPSRFHFEVGKQECTVPGPVNAAF